MGPATAPPRREAAFTDPAQRFGAERNTMKPGLAFLLAALIWGCGPVLAADPELSFPRFGTVTLYSPPGAPDAVALFVSGDGGWNQGVVDMARQLSSLGALVVGIDIRAYLKAMASGHEACAYPAADFEALGKYVQKQRGFSDYLPPVLVGYSSGATLVYAVLAQAPGNTFAGALSLGFCPDLDTGKPLCRGAGLTWKSARGGSVLDPVRHLEKPWIALQGGIDQVCAPARTREFVAQVPRGKIVELPNVGHGFSVYRNWLPQFRAAFQEIAGGEAARSARSSPSAVADLPLVEVPSASSGGARMAVFYSGDGGWASLDQGVSSVLAARGLPVVGFDCLKYFWQARTPEKAAEDLVRILDHYRDRWQARGVVLVGYSFGADVLPFLASRLPPEAAARIELLALLGPSPKAVFEFHLSDWIGGGSAAGRPVAPEIWKLATTPILCLYGDQEDESLCRSALPPAVTAVPLKGAHHFGGDYQALAQAILERLTSPPPKEP